MIKQKEHFHGSDLEKIEAMYGIKKEDITSFSANVNPLGISYKLRDTLASHIDSITAYPDREYTSLRKCIGSYINADYENILTGNGSTELISLLIRQKASKKALLLAPSYSEYEREVTLCGGKCDYYTLKEEDDFVLQADDLCQALNHSIDLLVICNPNNPTSSQISGKDMRKIVKACQEYNIFVMVDETYIEFSDNMPETTAVPLTAEYDNIMVLRGISKFFAAPGLRLGYAVCGDKNLLRELDGMKNPWTINSLAAIAGEIMFTDDEYILATRELITKERNRIYSRLLACDAIKVYPSHANFVLARIKKDGITASTLFDAAIKKGLMIRDCSSFAALGEKFFRFCFMREEDNDRLLNVLFDVLQSPGQSTRPR